MGGFFLHQVRKDEKRGVQYTYPLHPPLNGICNQNAYGDFIPRGEGGYSIFFSGPM